MLENRAGHGRGAGTVGIPTRNTEGTKLFIGRERELAELSRALDACLAGRGSTWLVAGDPGIGKTLLAREFCDRARAAGARAAWGRAWEGGGAPPYWPWIEVLRAVQDPPPTDDTGSAAQGSHERLLARLLPGVARDETTPSEPRETEEARFRLFDAVAQTLEDLARRTALVVVLDDIHAADASTLLLARFVARRIADMPLLLVGTYRGVEAARHADVGPLIADLARDARCMHLQGLARDEVALLLRPILDRTPSEETVDLVARTTEGNPLFVHGIGRVLRGRAHDPTSPEDLEIPRDIREVIARRLALLSPESFRTISICAVAGRHFDPEVVAAVDVGGRAAVARAIDEAVDIDLVAEERGPAGEASFAHPLYHQTVYRSLPAEEVARLHERLGTAVEHLRQRDIASHMATLAFHFVRAVPAGEIRRAYEYSRGAAEHATETYSFEEAARHYAQALELLGTAGGGDGERLELTLRLGRAQLRAGRADPAMATLDAAAQLARSLESWRHLALIALEQAWDQAAVFDEPRRLELLDEALEAVAERDPVLRAGLLARHAVYSYWTPSIATGPEYARAALEIAREHDDARVLGDALLANLMVMPPGPDACNVRMPLIDEVFGIARRTGDLELEMQARLWKMHTLLEQGDRSGWERERDLHVATARRIGMPVMVWYATALEATRATIDGRAAEALSLAQEALEIGMSAGRPEAAVLYGGQLGAMALSRSDYTLLAPFADAYRAMLASKPELSALRVALAAMEADGGNQQTARVELRAVCANGFAAVRRDRNFLTTLVGIGEAAVMADDAESAERVYDALKAYENLIVVTGRGLIVCGPAARFLGTLLAFLGRYDEALRYLEKAIALAERLSSPTYRALAHYWYGWSLSKRGRQGDADNAAQILDIAASTFARLELPRAVQRTRSLLDGLAPEVGAVAPRLVRKGDYWAVTYGGTTALVRTRKGLEYIERLLEAPGRELHALELVEDRSPTGTTTFAPTLDARAKKQVRDRIRTLHDDIEEAERFADTERAARAREEAEELTSGLAAALGLGGRDRALGSTAERARLNVTRAIRSAIETIERHHPSLGEHLSASIRTGTFCSYSPGPGGHRRRGRGG